MFGGSLFGDDGGGEAEEESQAPRKPLLDRLQDANAHCNASAISLPNQPQDGEVVVVTTERVWYDSNDFPDGEVANITAYEVDTTARLNDTPYITTLASALEKQLSRHGADGRWILVMPETVARYHAVYQTLYTGRERGAQLQLIAAHPENRQDFLALEVHALDWPEGPSSGSGLTPYPISDKTLPNPQIEALRIIIQADTITLATTANDDQIAVPIQTSIEKDFGKILAASSKLRENVQVAAFELYPQPRTTMRELFVLVTGLLKDKTTGPVIEEFRFAPPNTTPL